MALKIELNLANAITNRVAVPFSEYEGKLPPAPSENWERVCLAQDLANRLNGKPHLWDLDRAAEWYPAQRYCGSEDFSRIYSDINISATIAARELFGQLGHSAGRDYLAGWCKATAGYMALGMAWGVGRGLDFSKINIQIGKPQFLIGDGSPSSRNGSAPFLVWAGDRSFAHDGLGHLSDGPAIAMTNLAAGNADRYFRATLANPILAAIRGRGWDAGLVSAADSEIVRRASANDLDAMLAIWNEWLPLADSPSDRFLVIRRTAGVEWVRLRGTGAPTAPLDYCSWRSRDGQTRYMAANDGWRLEYIRPSAVDVIGDHERFRAHCVNKPEQAIECDAEEGAIVFAAIFGDGLRELVYPKPPSPPPPPEPPPPPPPKKKPSWIERMGL